jgi:glycosyltransferase involved in cell wall biosynthesis
MSRNVVIVQRRLTHYRVPFFNKLRDLLAERDINLRLLVGEPTPVESLKKDEGTLLWAEKIPTSYKFGFCWQPFTKYISDADLVIVTQENKLIYNLLAMSLFRPRRLAFWGHGANLQSQNRNGLKERFKRWSTNQVDWWFAYTQMSADLVGTSGFPATRITVLNNAVDTSELQRQRQTITLEETQALRESLGFGKGEVGVFVGSLYSDKRLDFLFDAATAIRQHVPDFHLLIIGDGYERDMVKAWCAERTWARWIGSRIDREKAAYVSMAQVMLNPGLVGLGILDSFVCEVPMLTTDCGVHSPEISYLENGINGFMASNDLAAYVDACVDVLQDSEKLEALRAGCRASAKEYTLENMALRFTNGVVYALAS